MDIENRRLKIIQQIISTDDEVVIAQLEDILKEHRIHAYENNLKPMTQEEFEERTRKSEEEYRNGQGIDLDDLIEESENW